VLRASAPEREQYAKVAALDNSIQVDIDVMARWTFADVGDAVGVCVGELIPKLNIAGSIPVIRVCDTR
jgi:hypothetical protein